MKTGDNMKKSIVILIVGIILMLPVSLWAEGTASSGTPAIGENTLDTREALQKLVTSTLIIIVLGGAAIYLAKRVMPKVNAAMGKEIKIVESLRLGPRKQLHIVRVGNRMLLVGSGGETVAFLADVTEAMNTGGKAAKEGTKDE